MVIIGTGRWKREECQSMGRKTEPLIPSVGKVLNLVLYAWLRTDLRCSHIQMHTEGNSLWEDECIDYRLC